MIKPIETTHDGYRFRSRLEARWAIFLDSLGLEYVYEPEGYEFPDGTRYLPDFWLPRLDMYIEVKPTVDIAMQDKNHWSPFVLHCNSLTICTGVPGHHETRTFALLKKTDYRLRVDTALGKKWTVAAAISNSDLVIALNHHKDGLLWLLRLGALIEQGQLSPEAPATNKRIMADIERAWKTARGTRFEWNEREV
jgi:hypothetical protein